MSQPMLPWQKHRLNIYIIEFQQLLDLNSIIPFLTREYHLLDSDIQEIQKNATYAGQISCLLQKLSRRSAKAFDCLVYALESTNQFCLAKLLTKPSKPVLAYSIQASD